LIREIKNIDGFCLSRVIDANATLPWRYAASDDVDADANQDLFLLGKSLDLQTFKLIKYSCTINHPPTADADGPYTANEGSAIPLDASLSYDSDGDELSYAWDLDGDGEFDDATGIATSIVFCSDQYDIEHSENSRRRKSAKKIFYPT